MAPAPGQRIRFVSIDVEQLPADRCRVQVDLERPGGSFFTGTSEGLRSESLKCAAQASLSALGKAAETDYHFELLGVKSVNAFDAKVVIVALAAQGGGRGVRLVGSYLSENGRERAAAVAVLNATNRLISSGPFAR